MQIEYETLQAAIKQYLTDNLSITSTSDETCVAIIDGEYLYKSTYVVNIELDGEVISTVYLN